MNVPASAPIEIRPATDRDAPRHVFLSGNFRPVREELDFENLKVTGAWPDSLQGTLVQAGPNPVVAPRGGYHPFEGSAMLHAVRIDGRGAHYRNRFVETLDHVAEKAAGRSLTSSITEPPSLDCLAAGRFPYRDAPNATVVSHAGGAWALGGFHAPVRVDPITLQTLGREEILGVDNAPFGGHTKRDPETGELFYFRCHLGPDPRLSVGGIDRGGRRTFEAAVELQHPRLMHDFAVSKHFAVFLDTGVSFDRNRAAAGHSGWHFDPVIPSRLLVVPREGGAVRAFPIEPCVVVHTLNAWESPDGRSLTLLALRYPSVPEVISFDHPRPTDPSAPHDDAGLLWEWTLDLRTGGVASRALSRTPAEYPRQDESLLMRRTERAWLAATLPLDAVVEVDLASGEERLLRHGRGRYGSEFVFVGRPEGAPECGFLLGFIWDSRVGRSEVVALDTEKPEQPVVARILLPCRVPFGFHLTWLPETGRASVA